jgi:hypothetical protein
VNLAQDFRDCVKTVPGLPSRRDAVNIAQDLSPGTAFRVNELVPEARLRPCLADQSACLS